ncbi:MAG: hypothetical protein QT03_C0001G0978 [archaeon GW2011_AR10]|uniref:Transglutaminase-like domain-containing protein n=1 Tax=Candidatus Iainarchaeum sp. TaxID=3101447 RepID=A0A7J4ITT1_9ARCH|nr:MAG: hypothetical protein QT03_C0001G0978 [archaeon GW2011_AR10]HIH08911.1 hypothetical protein [Candidatus Diapherotrites archaeon]
MGFNELSGISSQKLSRTDAEQSILRAIQALEVELREETDSERKHELREQIAELRSALVSVHGPSYSRLEEENRKLKKELAEAKKMLSRALDENRLLRKGQRVLSDVAETAEEKMPKFKLYALLLEKYSDIINEFEKKTVGEIKGLVDAENLSVQSMVAEFKPENYLFEKNYLAAARKVFEFVSREFTFVKADLDLNFWLSPKEILAEKIGDDEDLAVFLCSLLRALGDEKAEVVIAELDNLSTHAFVITEFNGRFFILDPSQRHSFDAFSGEKARVLASYSFNDSKIKRFLYKFNNKNYEQFI